MHEINKFNPDVLSCLANLSSDEVFTPPDVVNNILNDLPVSIWSDPKAKFLEPASKSGVFLREIVKRLMFGLNLKIPNKQERIDHILLNQVYGIATTELTSLISRRTLYCSKYANGKFSVSDTFSDESGNILFPKTQHTWKKGNCVFCGAREKVFSRQSDAETYAYPFIHDNYDRIRHMKFDVIVGNPPYQLDDGGHGASAAPIYHKFVQQAIKLNPRFITMIIPSRWFTGGRVGDLYDFREQMLNDKRLRILHDFTRSKDVFPGVEIKGGVNYFLWDRDNQGKCKVYSHYDKDKVSESERFLLEDNLNTFVRTNEAIPILKKVRNVSSETFDKLISANDAFGFDVRQKNSMKRVKVDFKLEPFEHSIPYYYNGWKKNGLGYINGRLIRKNHKFLNGYKLFVPKAIGTGDSSKDIIKAFKPDKLSCSSETYLVVGMFDSPQHQENALSYINTKFFHFLVGLMKNTQESRRNVYSLVPVQDFSERWDDEKLYNKYGFVEDEIAFIENLIPDLN